MAHEKNTKLKLPQTVADIQGMEDKVSEIVTTFRNMRTRMSEKNMETVDLKPGTFLHYLGLARAAMMDFPSELEKQIFLRDSKQQKKTAKADAKQAREQIVSRRAKSKQ